MHSDNISNLSLDLLKIVVNYKPVYGSPSQINDEIRQAFAKYPRHQFVDRFRLVSEMWENSVRTNTDAESLKLIYTNQPLMYVGEKGASLQASSSEPAFIIHLLSLLDIRPSDKILEIGCGTGWLLAMMAELSGHAGNVTGVEIVPHLAAKARSNLQSVGLGQVNVLLTDGNALPVNDGLYDRIMYTASSFLFPQYLFEICKIGARVVIPLRNKGLAEEVQILERTEWGFQSVDARLCKFVQMTQRYGSDRSGIKTSDDAPRYNIQHGRKHAMDIQGGPPGALSFSSFMSKTRPNYLVVGLSDPKISPSLTAGVSGDPSSIGQCLLSPDWTSGAVWNRGTLFGFGDESYEKQMLVGLSEWISFGQPLGAQFRLALTRTDERPPLQTAERFWIEERGDTTFTWSLPA